MPTLAVMTPTTTTATMVKSSSAHLVQKTTANVAVSKIPVITITDAVV